jgi:hypothetical protein
MAQLEQSTEDESVIDQTVADDAFNSFTRSRALYRSLLEEEPASQSARFDMGIADFYVGYTHLRTGALASAEQPFKDYAMQMEALYREDPSDINFIFEFAASKQALFNLRLKRVSTFTPELEADMTAAIDAAEAAVAAVPGEPAMLDALSVVMNMASSALARECLYDDPRILSFRQRALDSAQQVFEQNPRNREAKGVVAEMHSALAQTYASLAGRKDRTSEAREHFLAAYRLRVELADTDPSNMFYATQVMRSRLSLQNLRLHDVDLHPESFTEQQALTGLGLETTRESAEELGLGMVWLLYSAENALIRHDDAQAAQSHLHTLIAEIPISVSDEAVVFTTLQARSLLNYLSDTTVEGASQQNQNLKLWQSQDCRSRFTRRLWHSLTGDYDLAAQELEGIRERGVTYPAMDFYEQLISQSEGSHNPSGHSN